MSAFSSGTSIVVSRRALVLSGATIVVAAALAYHHSFGGPFVFDDPPAIVTNASIRHWGSALHPPTGGGTVTGRPILNLSFALNYIVSGTQVWSYHALNLLIHVFAGLVLFGIARRTWTENVLAPLAIAVIWTVHPLQTESVTYIVQRAESLMGLFYLLTLYGFIRGAASSGRSRQGWFALAVAACLLGMGTKEVMVSAPVIVLLYDRTFVSGSFRDSWRRHRWPYLGLGATWLFLACLVVAAKSRNGTAGFGIGVSWWQYLLTQFPAVVRYLELAEWPHPLVFDYGAQWIHGSSQVLPPAIFVIVLVAGTGYGLVSKSDRGRALGFAGVWFCAILAPTSLVPGLRQTMAEHRMYLALVPVTAIWVLAAARLGRWGLWACVALSVAFAGDTILRNEVYRSDLALWRDTVAGAPDNPFARNNLALALADEGRLPEAVVQYRAALHLDPALAEVHNNLGIALVESKRLPEAISEYETALRLNPGYAEAHNDLGIALLEFKQWPEATVQFEQALRINPDYIEAHNGLGNALAHSGRAAEARYHYEEALRLKPDDAEAENGLGVVLAGAGQLSDALGHFERALRLDPNYADAHNNLGDALAKLGRPDDARAQFAAALQRSANDPAVRANLGKVLGQMGRLSEAISQYQEAVRLDPGAAAPHFGLANVLAQAGHTQAALDQYAETLRCQPDYAEAHNNLGTALARSGRVSAALAHFQDAVRLDPGNAGFHANLGNALAQSGRNAEAGAEYEEALRINPKLTQVRGSLARLQAAAGSPGRK